MADILGIFNHIQQQGEKGRESGLARLLGKAYNAPPDQRQAMLGQVAQHDGGLAMQADRSFQQGEAEAYSQLADRARAVVAMWESNPQMAQSAYASMLPIAQRAGIGNVPPQLDASLIPGLTKLAQAGGSANNVQSRFVAEDGRVLMVMRDGSIMDSGEKADRQMWLRDHPGMPPHLVGKDAQVRPIGGASYVPQSQQQPQTQFMGGDGAPVQIDPSLPPQVQAAIRANESQWAQAPDQSQANIQVPGMPANTGLARPSQAQVAGEQEAAKRAVGLQFAPAENALAVDRATAIARAQAQATSETKRGEEARQRSAALQQFDAGMSELEAAMAETATGPIAGRIPAVTADQQRADGAVAAMAPVLKQLFRSAGEGVFTDRDQALLLEMLPSRVDHPEARKAKIANVRRMVEAKLQEASSDQPASGQFSGFRVLD